MTDKVFLVSLYQNRKEVFWLLGTKNLNNDKK